MSASRFSNAEVGKLWGAALQSGLLGRVDATLISEHRGIPIDQAHLIVRDLIEISFYDPVTRRMDPSKLPPMKWTCYTPEEFEAFLRAHF